MGSDKTHEDEAYKIKQEALKLKTKTMRKSDHI